jgi:hypothetical protein
MFIAQRMITGTGGNGGEWRSILSMNCAVSGPGWTQCTVAHVTRQKSIEKSLSTFPALCVDNIHPGRISCGVSKGAKRKSVGRPKGPPRKKVNVSISLEAVRVLEQLDPYKKSEFVDKAILTKNGHKPQCQNKKDEANNL